MLISTFDKNSDKFFHTREKQENFFFAGNIKLIAGKIKLIFEGILN
jgi:hypothetical protein